eukprot:2601039-Rhodomonas_salina.2
MSAHHSREPQTHAAQVFGFVAWGLCESETSQVEEKAREPSASTKAEAPSMCSVAPIQNE